LLIIASPQAFSQSDKEKVGSELRSYTTGGFFDFSEKNKVNIEVNVWGFIKNPGKYIIPKGSTFQDIISYTGGILNETKLDEIKLYRPKNDSLRTKDEIIDLNYNDFFWEEKINLKNVKNPVLEPGDILVFPGGPRYFFRDNLGLITSLSSLLISIVTLILTISNK
jgi:hypothetical protein